MKKKMSKREKLLVKQDFKCFYCGDKFGPYIHSTFDHKIPVSRGGNSTIHNLVLACQTCNYQKNNLTTEEYLSPEKGGAKWSKKHKRWVLVKAFKSSEGHETYHVDKVLA